VRFQRRFKFSCGTSPFESLNRSFGRYFAGVDRLLHRFASWPYFMHIHWLCYFVMPQRVCSDYCLPSAVPCCLARELVKCLIGWPTAVPFAGCALIGDLLVMRQFACMRPGRVFFRSPAAIPSAGCRLKSEFAPHVAFCAHGTW
jgi:hypothetical protein